MKKNKVFICGAGPGDPGLITVKGMNLIKNCDVVFYDRLVDKKIIDEIPENSEKIFVGRSVGDSPGHQDYTNRLMVTYARKGKKVLRLKGGDPFVFGRGAEEAEFLFNHDIKFEIVPGVTSAIGAAAYAGIPLTHRLFASSVVIVTGHEDPAKGEPTVNWGKIALAADTIVVLMGIETLPRIVSFLIKSGLRSDTNVAIIENATTIKHREIIGNLGNIVRKAENAKVKSPAVIIIGKVVTLQKKLGWFYKHYR
jgi:uroporphyrin-III C-methyltransferase